MNDGLYVGPARVLACDGPLPKVQVLGSACETVDAQWAIPFRYEPVVGDLLLVIGRAGRYWITGIVRGAGRSQLAFDGNTELRARGDALQLNADGGLRVHAPEVRIDAELRVLEAATDHQRCDDADCEVRERLDERAGECLRDIDGDDTVTAARHEVVAGRVVRRDGALVQIS